MGPPESPLLSHLAILFLGYLLSLFSPSAPLPSSSRIHHHLLRILAPRGSGSGVRGFSAQVAGSGCLGVGLSPGILEARGRGCPGVQNAWGSVC